MAANKDVVLGLTIFLAVSAVLLTVAVVCIAMYFRKLRKKIQAEFFSDTKEIKKLTVRKRNKYTPSRNRKNVKEPSYYESPPLTENRKERLQQRALQKQNANITDDTTMEMKEKPKLSDTDSYIICINDDLAQDYGTQFNESRHDEELNIERFEDEANDDVFALSHKKPVTRGRDPVTQHQESLNMKSHAKTMPRRLSEVSSVPKSSYNTNRTKTLKTFESRVTQHVVTHNASVSSNRNNLKYTSDPLADDQEMYEDMQSDVDGHAGYDNNQVIIDDVNNRGVLDNTGIPTLDDNTDEIYGNQDIIDDERRKRFSEYTGYPSKYTGYPSKYTGYPSDEEIYENQQIVEENQRTQYDVTSDASHVTHEIYENYDEENVYQNTFSTVDC